MMTNLQTQSLPQAANTRKVTAVSGSSGVGRYRVKVVETRLIRRFRRLAIRKAGFGERFAEFDGSAEQYLQLPPPVRQDADVHLSQLVVENQARLTSSKALRASVEVYA